MHYCFATQDGLGPGKVKDIVIYLEAIFMLLSGVKDIVGALPMMQLAIFSWYLSCRKMRSNKCEVISVSLHFPGIGEFVPPQ